MYAMEKLTNNAPVVRTFQSHGEHVDGVCLQVLACLATSSEDSHLFQHRLLLVRRPSCCLLHLLQPIRLPILSATITQVGIAFLTAIQIQLSCSYLFPRPVTGGRLQGHSRRIPSVPKSQLVFPCI